MSFDMNGTGGAAAGAAVGVGAAAAQGGMNPIADITAAISLVGLGMSVFGGNKQADAAKKESQISQNIAGLEMKVNAQHKQQMELQVSRAKIQSIRNAQQSRSLALAAATNQGAGFGSGLAGGLGQIGGDAATNMLNLNQNAEIGENIFGLNDQISQQKIAMAQVGGKMADAQGLTAMGGAITSSAKPLGQLGGDLFGSGTTKTET